MREVRFATAAAPVRESPNWAGYVVPATGTPFSSIAATFVVPTVACGPTPTGELSVWVGVDGVSGTPGGRAVFQDGVAAACTVAGQRDTLWWEYWPAESEQVLSSAVNPGDTILAHVWAGADASGQRGWLWSITDETTGETFTASAAIDYPGPAASADFVVEDPLPNYQVPGVYAPFPCFSGVTFLTLSTTPALPAPTAADCWRIVKSAAVLASGTPPREGAAGLQERVLAGLAS